MKDIMLLLRQRKGIYLSLLCITGIVSVLLTWGLQKDGTTLGDTYAVVSILMFWVISMVAFAITPKSEKEFFESLPVKKTALELYPYAGFLLIFAVDILLAVITSAIGGEMRSRISGLAPKEFIFLCLALLATGTLTYLCIGTFKDPVWGIGASIGIWFGTVGSVGFFENGIISLSVTAGIVILTTAVAIMVLLMVLHAHYRELSGGKLGYFRAADAVALTSVAVMIFYLIYLVSSNAAWALLAVIIVEAAIYHQVFHKKHALKKIEIRAYAQKKNPWFFFHLPTWLVTMALLLLLVLGIVIRKHMVLMQLMTELVDIVGTQKIFALWSEIEDVAFLNTTLPVFVIGLLSIHGSLRYFIESQKETREFLERLPVSRKKRYTTMVTMDLLLIVIPILFHIILCAGCYLSYQKMYDVVLLTPLTEDIIRSLILFCYAMTVLGILYLVDAVTVGALKIFNYPLIVMTIAVLVSIAEGLFQSQFNQTTLLRTAIPCLVIGLFLIMWSGRLYIKREQSQKYFYYKPAMHIFAILYAAVFAFFVITLTQHVFWYVIAAVGAIVIYCAGIKACMQPEGNNANKKVLKNHTK